MDGFILTRLEHLETLGLLKRSDLTKSVKRTREALDATDAETEGPDHPIRLKAADQFFKLADLYPKRDANESDPSRPIAVQIVLTGHASAGAAVSSHGVRLHLEGHNGDRA